MNNKKYFSFIEVIIIIVITGIVCGISSGLIILNASNINQVAYADLSNNKAIKEFLEVYASIVTDYYENIDEDELINSAINAMMEYLGDDYTNYLSKEKTAELLEKLSGEYEGIGVQIIANNLIKKVFENSPAQTAGLKENDQIVKVNGTSVSGKQTTEISNMIKQSPNGVVKLTVLREEQELEIEATLKKLNVPSVESEIIDSNNKKIGYIYIDTFSNTTATQFQNELVKMEKARITSLIIDVRDNSGGYLASAKDIANLFIEKGKIIYSLEDKGGIKNYKSDTNDKRNYKIAVITNKTTASASEILAAALKESYGAVLVGETTFGKGKVQQTMDLDSGGMVKYTSARWMTPKGECIDRFGIKPDYEVKADQNMQPSMEASDEAWQNYSDYLLGVYEIQLQKAIEVLAK